MSKFKLICVFSVVLVFTASLACDSIWNAEPTPTPTPVLVNQMYEYLEDLNTSNVAELREKEGTWFRFRGRVDTIEEKMIRFYVEPPRALADDSYVECNFGSNANLISLRTGVDVTVRGKLVRAFRGRLFGIGELKALVFEDCKLVEIHRPSTN